MVSPRFAHTGIAAVGFPDSAGKPLRRFRHRGNARGTFLLFCCYLLSLLLQRRAGRRECPYGLSWRVAIV